MSLIKSRSLCLAQEKKTKKNALSKDQFYQTKAALSRSIRTPKRCHSLWWIHISWVVSRHASTAPPFHDMSRGSMSWSTRTLTYITLEHLCWYVCVSLVLQLPSLDMLETLTWPTCIVRYEYVQHIWLTFGLVVISTLSTSLLKEGGILLMMRWSRNSWAPWNMRPPPTTKMELYILRLVSSDAVKKKKRTELKSICFIYLQVI